MYLCMLVCKRCGYRWVYKGNGYYTSCPKCHTNVRTEKVIVKEEAK